MDPVDIVSIHQLLARYGHVADMPPSDLRNVFTTAMSVFFPQSSNFGSKAATSCSAAV